MPSSQTRPHAPHAPPFAVSRHFASSIVGTKVLFAFAIRLMNAESGHSLWHHFLNSSTSAISSAGTTMSDQVTSPCENRLMTSRMVANVSPMGQTRQNTGNPKTKVDASAPPSTKWRASSAAPRLEAQDAHPPPSFDPFEHETPSASISTFVSGAAAGSAASPRSTGCFFANKPRNFCTSGTGHIHPQNARANTTMSSTITTSETTARGTIILEASIVPKAPSGHRMEISQMPGADMVPIPTFVTKPTVTTATMASATRVRSFLEFFFMRTPYPSTSSSG